MTIFPPDWKHFYFSLNGRATRYDYNVRMLLVIILATVAAGLLDFLFIGAPILSNIVNLAFLWPNMALNTRRLHDLNLSGWWQAPIYVPIVVISIVGALFGATLMGGLIGAGLMAVFAALIYCIFFLGFYLFLSAKRGTIGLNKYGLDPLQNDKILIGV